MDDSWDDLARIRLVAPSAGATRQEYTRYLDGEIHSLEVALLQARQLRNAHNAFVSLPDELLLRIMLLHRDTAPANPHGFPWKQSNTCPRHGSFQLWTGIAAVCRRFRDVAHAPLLYASMSDHNLPPQLIKRILARFASSSAPLTLELGDGAYRGFSNAATEMLQDIMLHHSNRLHTLYLNDLYSEEIYAKGNVVERLLWPICKLPSLKSLSINHYISTEKFIATAHHNWEFIEPLRPDGQPLEEWRFPPSLEKLELVITPFPWKCPIYDNLVDLSFISMHIDLADMIDLFSRMHRLEHLFFDRVGITYDVDVGEHPGLFELSDEEYERLLERVRRDFLQEQARSCLLPTTLKTWSAVTHATAEFNPLLKLMGPSASTSHTVKLLGQPSILRNEVASFLSAHFPRLAGSHDMVLSAEFNLGIKRSSEDENKDTIRVRTVFSRTLDRDVTPDLVLEYAYTTKLNSDKGQAAQQLPANYLLGNFKDSGAELLNLEALPCFDTIVDLSLDCDFPYSREAWADALGLFPALVTLRIPENMLPDMMSTLARYQSTIPEIHALHVRSSQQYGFKSSRSTVDMLIDWLISRKAGGSPLKDVRMPSALDAEITACYGEGEWRSFLEK